MELIIDLVKIIVPAGLVLYAVYLTLRTFLNREAQKQYVDIKSKNLETVLPLRLQAYERLCLFLERITPANLFRRLNKQGLTALQLQQIAIKEIRDELNHNLSQQVYISDEVWHLVQQSSEEVIAIINQGAEGMSAESQGSELAKKVFNINMNLDIEPTKVALLKLKEEARMLY